MIRWPHRPTSSDAGSTCRIGRKKADEDRLQLTVRNILRKLSRPMNKNCPTADRRLGQRSVQNLSVIFQFLPLYGILEVSKDTVAVFPIKTMRRLSKSDVSENASPDRQTLE
ncbi:hypothetical protein DPX16_14115 [Anabarilius grahami]|uniref:Uncharacterized protein n=1 Tax=Anabarilius grahami TaxID=495550 RepID=A0A3N0YAF2_ANAGA|nr:hypothetical protein DPX16_14115 [Anabarilius grahami]